MLKWVSLITVLALAAGVGIGATIGASGNEGLIGFATEVEYLGALWLNALRMTVIPLVFSLMVTGIASVADAAAAGRLAIRALLVFAVLLGTATLYACLALPVAYSLWPVDQAAAATLAARGGGVEAVSPPSIGQWLSQLAPSNVVQAAAESAILPLVVFAIFFGFGATRLPPGQRDPMVAFFRAVGDTMIIIVRWVLYAAPIGVFALALGVGLISGAAIVGLIVQYVVIACIVTFGVAVMAYLFAFIWGGVSPARFLSATAPALAVAFSSRSSLATLPLMVERMRDAMGVPDRIANVTLPMAVAIFRMTSPVTNLAVVFFSAQVFGVELTPTIIIAGAFVAIAVSIGSVGLPGEISFIASVAPICISMHVPIELLGILVAVEAIPDIFRTLGNVAGDMAATVITAKGKSAAPDESQSASHI
ncbi:MAG TPA: dicarboxylate/amino acid:cation symporter [Hyphomonadaceae bacterium]|jgi:Na+/H+-dicarboxylate symporter|nr:dicarboxylate/amino acid:cation symporter [Hyphomonadaceae bacterium]